MDVGGLMTAAQVESPAMQAVQPKPMLMPRLLEVTVWSYTGHMQMSGDRIYKACHNHDILSF